LSAMSLWAQVNFQWDDHVRLFIVLPHWNNSPRIDMSPHSTSLKHQSVDRHVATLGHIVLIPIQPVFALSPYCCVLSGEATNTYFIVSVLTRSGLESTIYHTRCEHANPYTTDAVLLNKIVNQHKIQSVKKC
jgi:hypothetical protein